MVVPSHFKGPHDGFGKDARKKASRGERGKTCRLPTIELCMQWLMDNMAGPSDSARARKKTFAVVTFLAGNVRKEVVCPIKPRWGC